MLLHLSPALRGGTLDTEGSKVDYREVSGVQHIFRSRGQRSHNQYRLQKRPPAMRHISKTHRVNFDWVYEVRQHPEIRLRYVRTTWQVADVLTKYFVKREVWDAFLTMPVLVIRSIVRARGDPESTS